MAVYNWSDVLSVVSQFSNRQFDANFAAFIADLAQSVMWNAADWKETIAPLPPFFVVPQQQDYGVPAAVIPADFKGLRKAFFVNIASDPPARDPLTVDRFLSETGYMGTPSSISYEQSNKMFRLFPRPGATLAAPYYLIDGTYKIHSTKLTPTTYANAPIIWDDYFNVVVAVAKLVLYDLKQDSENYARQFQIAKYLLEDMMADEALNTGDQVVTPTGGLMLGWYGLR